MRLRTAFQTWIFCVSVFLFAAITYAADAESQTPQFRASNSRRPAGMPRPSFDPITQADVAQAKTVLLEALGRLDQRLTQAGPDGEDWRKYLRWDALQESLRGDKQPDMALLARIHARYIAGYDGLELVWFLDVQHALHNYIATIGAVDNPQDSRRLMKRSSTSWPKAWMPTGQADDRRRAGHQRVGALAPRGAPVRRRWSRRSSSTSSIRTCSARFRRNSWRWASPSRSTTLRRSATAFSARAFPAPPTPSARPASRFRPIPTWA